MCAGVPGGSLEGPWGSLGSLGCLRSGIPSKPKQIKRTYCFLIYLKILSYYSVGQTIPLLWRVGLIWGPCGLPPLRDCLVALFDTNFDKKTCPFLMAFFQKLKISSLCTPSFILCSSFFLLWPSCFLKFPHMSCSFPLFPSFFSLKSQISAFWKM